MTDRELLELAAKAIGYWDYEFNCYKGPMSFDPLTDDGDALRLAVKLGIGLAYTEKYVWACKLDVCDIHEPRNQDVYAATRRTIVRAAAEIGKAL